MTAPEKEPLVITIKEKCKVCFTCVRDCPAKAIRISGGQAEVIQERCIGCGNCFKVCTQKAKKVRDSISGIESILMSGKAAACLAPSFPAEFSEISYKRLSGVLRKLGFSLVTEVAFGADLVSQAYRNLLLENPESNHIATTCPAIVSYVERYHPDLVNNLARIASPMVVSARVIKTLYGEDTPVVFIGPCIAKKGEAFRSEFRDLISAVLTFAELREMIKESGIDPIECEESEFDPPYPSKGTLYPIGRGMLQSAEIQEDLLTNTVFATDGAKQFVHTLKEYQEMEHNICLMELLCCNGCIMGPGMTTDSNHFSRRALVSQYAQERNNDLDLNIWYNSLHELKDIDLSVSFIQQDMRYPIPTRDELQKILHKKGKFNPEDELNCGACGYDTCIEHATAIYMGLAESDMCLPFTIENLKQTATELKESYEELMKAKNALIQSEKQASLGRMASGIAHEINNPLTGVLTYASLLLEDVKLSEHKNDLEIIVQETARCRKIVRGLLDFARESKPEKVSSNINTIITTSFDIIEKHIRSLGIKVVKDLSPDVPNSYMDINQMRSVINNLTENAIHAMPKGGTLEISTRYDRDNGTIRIVVKDTGSGIPEENLNKIFDPFFTTKSEGRGTGLGLAVTFGILQHHNGTISVKSCIGEGTTFTIALPKDYTENNSAPVL